MCQWLACHTQAHAAISVCATDTVMVTVSHVATILTVALQLGYCPPPVCASHYMAITKALSFKKLNKYIPSFYNSITAKLDFPLVNLI